MLFYDLFRNDPAYLEFESGATLLREGDVGHEMYVLIEGKAVIEYRDRVFAEIGPGDFVGELAVIDGSPRMATTTALTRCKVVVVDRQRFEYLVA